MKKKNCSLLSAIVLLLFINGSAYAELNAKQIEETLKISKDLTAGRRFNVVVVGNEVRVSTNLVASGPSLENDCKIEAVLIGREIMRAYAEVMRVNVDFYPPQPKDNFYQVSVSKPEILAFGSGQVSSGDLLSAIRMESKPDERAKAEEKAKAQSEEKKLLAKDRSKEVMQEALKKGEHPEAKWISYDFAPGIAFDYPAVWFIDKEMEGNTLAQIKSQPTVYPSSVIELKLYRSGDKKSVVDEARSHVREHMASPGYQLGEKSTIIKFGQGKAFSGVTESFSRISKKSKLRYYETSVYFGWPGLVYRFKYSCVKEELPHVKAVFAQVLNTTRLKQAVPASQNKR